jgi:uncharacterized repeat protein (TIGR01451 family)/MYXO-CTERM domain-containing protein
VVVGARRDDDAGSDSGSAYVFARSAGSWSQQDKLTASDAAAGDAFGFDVSIDGETAVIGSECDDSCQGSAYVFVAPTADLSLTKSSTPTQATVGVNFDYTLTVTNNGPATATSLTVTDTLPTGVIFVSASANCGESAGTVTCTAASLTNAANVVFTITVSPPTLFGNISNTASVTAVSPTDPNSSNNSIILVTFVTVPPGVPSVGTWCLVALALALFALVLAARRRRRNVLG